MAQLVLRGGVLHAAQDNITTVKQLIDRRHRDLEARSDLHSALPGRVKFNNACLLVFGKLGQNFSPG
jgi:hypothetical protein